jgi:nitroreductase
MNNIQPGQLLAQLNWRYATKQFDPTRKIDPMLWATLEDSLVLTPSSFGLQPWKFIVVRDAKLRESLVAASWGQRQVAEASHLVVFATPQQFTERDIDRFLDRTCEIRGVPATALAGYRGMMVGSLMGRDEAARQVWAANQVYIALGNFLTSAAVLGIDACPLEGIDPAKYDELLGLPARGLLTVVAAAAGYRLPADKYASARKVRYAKNELVLEL